MKKENRTQDELVQVINAKLKKGMTRKQMAMILKWSISKLNRFMQKHRIKNLNLPRYNYRIKTFAIENEITAYISGLFWADGHLSKSRLTITFTEKDSILIEIINQYFFGNYKAYKEDKKRRIQKLSIFNKQIRSDFLKLGLVNNDLGRSIPEIRTQLFRHFLRGIIDGDGHINKKYKKVNIAGRLDMLNQIGTILNTLGFQKSFGINESPKSLKTRQNNKYGTLAFYRFYQYNAFKLLYKNVNYYLPRKYEELSTRFLKDVYLIEHLRRKQSYLFVLKNFDQLSKKYGDIIRYAFPVLFHKNYNVEHDLAAIEDRIKVYLYQYHYSFPGVAYLIRKKGVNASETEIYRFCKRNNIFTQKLKEDKVIQDSLSKIHKDILCGNKTKTEIANDFKVGRRRLYRKCIDIKPLNKITMQNPGYFNRIDTSRKAFFTGFLLMRNSINRKFLHVKLSDPKYRCILDNLAHQLYGRFIPKVILSEQKYTYTFGSTKLVNSLRQLGVDKKSIKVKNYIDKRLHKSFALGMLYAKLTVFRLKNGHCAQISGKVEIINWFKTFLEGLDIHCKKERNNLRKLVFLKGNYHKLIEYFGSELHDFHTGNLSDFLNNRNFAD